MQVYLKCRAFAHQLGANLVVPKEVKERLLALFPHFITLTLASIETNITLTSNLSNQFMRKLDLIDFIQSRSRVFENSCDILIKFQI